MSIGISRRFVGLLQRKFQAEGDVPTNHLCAVRQASECLTIEFTAKCFHKRNLAAYFFERNVLLDGKRSLSFLGPFGGRWWGGAYGQRTLSSLRPIRNLVVAFLLVIIELFFAWCFCFVTIHDNCSIFRRFDGQ